MRPFKQTKREELAYSHKSRAKKKLVAIYIVTE